MAGKQGFTLIELSIVLLVLGLILGGLLMPLTEQMHNSRVKESTAALDEAKQALLGFALANKRLPCPDSDADGLENTPPCNNVEGLLPWASLGLDYGDAWRRPIRYRADDNFTQAAGIADPADTGSGLRLQDRSGAAFTAADPEALAAVLFSCGDNGKPDNGNDADSTVNADANCTNPGNPDSFYIMDTYLADVYDDIVISISKNVLIYKMASVGKWP